MRSLPVIAGAMALFATLLSGGSGSEATFPGQNGRIAFASERGGNVFHLYSMAADGSDVQQLTSGLAHDLFPSYSPDGTRIVFVRDPSGVAGNDSREIWMIDADGGNETRLTNNIVWDGDPSWSADGSKILFATERDGDREVYSMDLEGDHAENLTNRPASADRRPKESPASGSILFETDRDGNSEIYVMDGDGANPTNLTNQPAHDSAPEWSPDGEHFVFVSDRNAGANIWRANADGTSPTQFTVQGGYEPAYSPAGTSIVFSTDRDAGDFEIYVMEDNGSNEVRLSESPGEDAGPSWQPLVSAPKKGDNDCDGDVDATDALKGLQYIAGIPYGQTAPCTAIGDGEPVFGDMDCDGDADAVDSLLILQFVAALPVNLPQGCPDIG